MITSYNPETHIYTINGAVVPSVTKIIASLTNYSFVKPAVLEAAQIRGNDVHRMAKDYIHWGEIDSPLSSDYSLLCLKQFIRWWETEGIKFKSLVCDIKTRKFNKHYDPVQLEAYDLLAKAFLNSENNGEIFIEAPMYHENLFFAGTPDIVIFNSVSMPHYILYLSPNEYKFIAAEKTQSLAMFRWLLDHFYNPSCSQDEVDSVIKNWKNS